MGHYLSDFETDDEFRERTIYGPMRKHLRIYDDERARGLMHTPEYTEQMERARELLEGRIND